jgi:UPF0755 protein
LRTLITLFLLAVLAAGGWIAWQLYAPVAPPANTFLLLRPGYSSRRIAIELRRAGVIRNERVFWLWHALHHKRSLKAGEYQFDRQADLPRVYDRIARGDIYFHVVTIPEGYTMFDIAKDIEGAGLGSADDFLHIAETQTQLIQIWRRRLHRWKAIYFRTPTSSHARKPWKKWRQPWFTNSAKSHNRLD